MTGFGVPRSSMGGTTTEDIQRIIAAEYQNAGIIDGCDVTGNADMTYSISAGAVVLDTGPNMAIQVPVAAQTVPTVAAPTIGSRTDTIYVQQRFPTAENPDNSSIVGVTDGVAPANSIVLDRRTVTAGTTATTATTSIHNRKFARPTGGTMGRLHMHIETDGTSRNFDDTFTRGAGSIYVPTDRDIEFHFTSTVSQSSSTGGAPNADWFPSLLYTFYLDGEPVRSWERGISRLWESKFLSFIVGVPEGEHTVHYTVRGKYYPSGASSTYRYWTVRHGGADKYVGDAFRIYDRGVIFF